MLGEVPCMNLGLRVRLPSFTCILWMDEKCLANQSY